MCSRCKRTVVPVVLRCAYLLWVCWLAQRDKVVVELSTLRPTLEAANQQIRDLQAECAGLNKELEAARDSAVKLAALAEGARGELEEVRCAPGCCAVCSLALVRGRLTLPPLQVRAQWEPEMQARIRSATDDAVTASEVAAAEAARLREELTQLRAESRDSNRRDASLASAALTSQVATLREESRRIRAESAAAAQESAGRILDLTTQVERLADENERLRVRVRRPAVHAWLPPGAFSPCCAWPALQSESMAASRLTVQDESVTQAHQLSFSSVHTASAAVAPASAVPSSATSMMSAKANAVTTRHLHARVQSLTAEVKRLRKQLAKSRREYDAVVARVGDSPRDNPSGRRGDSAPPSPRRHEAANAPTGRSDGAVRGVHDGHSVKPADSSTTEVEARGQAECFREQLEAASQAAATAEAQATMLRARVKSLTNALEDALSQKEEAEARMRAMRVAHADAEDARRAIPSASAAAPAPPRQPSETVSGLVAACPTSWVSPRLYLRCARCASPCRWMWTRTSAAFSRWRRECKTRKPPAKPRGRRVVGWAETAPHERRQRKTRLPRPSGTPLEPAVMLTTQPPSCNRHNSDTARYTPL